MAKLSETQKNRLERRYDVLRILSEISFMKGVTPKHLSSYSCCAGFIAFEVHFGWDEELTWKFEHYDVEGSYSDLQGKVDKAVAEADALIDAIQEIRNGGSDE